MQLKKKHFLNIAFDDLDYHMEMIAFSEKNIWFYNFKEKVEAVFIAFTYCRNSNKKLSYIVLYNDKKYQYHISFRCNEEEDCLLNDDLDITFKELNPKIKETLIKKIKSKHKTVVDFN